MQREFISAGVPSIGFTLLEVIVVLAIMGVTLGLGGLALASLKPPRESELSRELRRARSEAIRGGRPVRTVVNRTARPVHVLFLPDGRALGPGVDPLTGELRRATP